MKRITKLAVAGVALCLGVTAVAQSVQTRTPKGALVYQLVLKWGPHVREAYKTDAGVWAKQMGPTFAKADVATLEQSLSKRTFEAMNDSLLSAKLATTSATTSGLVAPLLLGEADRDLVFVPIIPCRIFDTRAAGGIIAAGTTRAIDVTQTSSYSSQGGSATNCGGAGSAGWVGAAVINFTSVQPATAGYFTAFPFGATAPLAATQVFSAGSILSNLAIVQLDQTELPNEMSIFAERDVHLVGDMVGYYTRATRPAVGLECVETALTITLVAASGGTGSAFAPACAAGYTQTATNCESSSFEMPTITHRNGFCSAKNNGAAAELRASSTCCRVPRF